jgi:hypothetical protein
MSCRSLPTATRPGWEGKRVTLSVPAATVAKLFADGILPVVGTRAVVISSAAWRSGPASRDRGTGRGKRADDVIALHVRPSDEATA